MSKIQEQIQAKFGTITAFASASGIAYGCIRFWIMKADAGKADYRKRLELLIESHDEPIKHADLVRLFKKRYNRNYALILSDLTNAGHNISYDSLRCFFNAKNTKLLHGKRAKAIIEVLTTDKKQQDESSIERID